MTKGVWHVEMMDGRLEKIPGRAEDFDRGVLDVMSERNHRRVISVHRTKGMWFEADDETKN